MSGGARYVILLGPPGAGKGTQAARIRQATGLPHVATGDLFRENVRDETQLGRTAKEYMDRGQLVPDAITIRMLLERISRPDAAGGVLLDGFPRTLIQAAALERALAEREASVDLVLYIDVSDEDLLRRLTSRWLCRRGPEIYNTLTNPPKVPGRCDVDGGELYQRHDDRPEAGRRRIEIFHRETEPLIARYEHQGRLRRIDGGQDVDTVGREMVGVLVGGVR